MSVRRWLSRCMAVAAILGLVALLGAWLTVQYMPGWYAPARVAPQNVQETKDNLTAAFTDFSEKVNRDEPFRFALSQEQVNRWLAVREEFGPQARELFPTWLSDPVIIMRQDRLGLAGTVSHKGFRSVVSLWWRIAPGPERVRVQLTGVRAGGLPIPHKAGIALVGRFLPPADGRRRDDPPSLVERVEQLLAGKQVENRFLWENGKREFRLVSLELTNGALRLTAQALPRSAVSPEWSWKSQRSSDWLGDRTSR